MEVRLINNDLVLDAIVDNPISNDGDEYAFYLMLHNEKVNEFWYSSHRHIQFPLPDKAGQYHVLCFHRNVKRSEKSRANSNRISVTPAIRWKIPQAVAIGRYKQLIYFRRVIFGDYESQKRLGYIPRVGAAPIPLLVPMNYGPRNDRNIEFALSSWKFLAPIWKVYFSSKKYKYLKELYTFFLDWNQSLEISNGKNSFAWYDMAVGTRAMHLALFLYVLNEEKIELSTRDSRILGDIINRHIEYLENEKNLKYNNHGVWQILGLRLLYWSRNETSQEKIDFCEYQLSKLIDLNFTEENVSSENSPFYHKYTADLICQIPTQLFAQTQARITAIQDKKDEISAWLTSPSGYFYLIGDSDDKGMLLKSKISCDFVQDDICYISKAYLGSGYAIVRTHPDTPTDDNAALIFHATSASYSHAHSDKLSFVFIHKGIELISDSGKYSYENDKWRKYFVSDRAHNTVGFTNKVFMPTDTNLGDSHIFECNFDNGTYYLSGETKKKDVLFEHKRILSFKPDEYLNIVDHIIHKCEGVGDIEVRLHFGIDISLQEINSRLVALFDNKIIASIEPDSRLLQYEIYSGSENPILGWSSRAYKKKKPINALVMRFAPDLTEIQTKIHLKASRFFNDNLFDDRASTLGRI
ncbi:heparinase II/III-like protein [Advenella incenata]|uniref:Heparinase II/III-like protein n=1 Tax=Advenella incenata TaxID=267800 RepID=A0A4Q7VE09_9BURK|nr:heparinase II/III-family protein [Advenella incenata]RZT94254.1 heparinase II/III-like protein [Advenella incenata]